MIDSILKSLNLNENNEAFCTSFSVPAENLTLKIKDLGEVTFPVSTKAAKTLIKHARPAKFGWKDQTVYDPDVRQVWEIPKSRINIAKLSWEKSLTPALEKVRRDLLLPEGSSLSAHLHNLLIYEPGHFFSAHQDSEKLDGMVATLVVLLPSTFSGGTLVVTQHADKKSFRAPRNNSDTLTFIAFYADCPHEIKEVTAGYRMALTYNLVAEDRSLTLAPEPNSKLVKCLNAYFEASRIDKTPSYRQDDPRWFVYLLDHHYSQHALGWSLLKGTDRSVASQLLFAASQLGLDSYLALADIHEVWEAEEDDYYEGYGRRGYWEEEEEEEEVVVVSKPSKKGQVAVGDIIDNECTLKHWMDSTGKPLSLKGHSVHESMIGWTKATNDFDPLKTEYEGYMGNYGNTVDKWYHRAAIVLWPKNTEFASFFTIDPDSTWKKILKLLMKNPEEGKKAIKQVLPHRKNIRLSEPSEALSIFNLASQVKNPDLAKDIVKNVGMEALSEKSLPGVIQLLGTYGEAWCLFQMQHWDKENKHHGDLTVKDLDSFIDAVSSQAPNLVQWLLKRQLASILNTDKPDHFSRTLSKEHLATIQSLLIAAREHPEVLKATQSHILEQTHRYDPLTLGEIALALNRRIDLKTLKLRFEHFFAEAKQRLTELGQKDRKDGDWSIKEPLNCKCRDCSELRNFLENPTHQTLVWPMGKPRRQHIHNIINAMGVPVTHVTQREGSPQKLVLKKTSDLFKKAASRQKAAAATLKKLEIE